MTCCQRRVGRIEPSNIAFLACHSFSELLLAKLYHKIDELSIVISSDKDKDYLGALNILLSINGLCYIKSVNPLERSGHMRAPIKPKILLLERDPVIRKRLARFLCRLYPRCNVYKDSLLDSGTLPKLYKYTVFCDLGLMPRGTDGVEMFFNGCDIIFYRKRDRRISNRKLVYIQKIYHKYLTPPQRMPIIDLYELLWKLRARPDPKEYAKSLQAGVRSE